MLFVKCILIFCSYLIIGDLADICAKGQVFAALVVGCSSDESGVVKQFKDACMADKSKLKQLRCKMIIKVTDVIAEHYRNKYMI